MKFKSVFLSIFLFHLFYCVSAQQIALPPNLSLEEAQEIALKNNPNIRIDALNVAISQKQVEQARWEKIPDIYANYDLRRNLIIPTTPVPAKAFNPDAPEGKLLPLKFSTNWTSNTGLNARVDLFNPQTHGKIKETVQQAALSKTDKEITANELKFKVGKDYGACIIAKEQLELAIADTISKSEILKMTREQYEAGRIKITDLNRAVSEKSNALSNYLHAVKILASARVQLLADMGYDPSQNYTFRISDRIPNLLSSFKKVHEKGGNSLSLKKWKQQKKLTEIQLQNIQSGFFPTVSLNGFYGSNYFDNDFDLFNNKNWYGNSYIGISVKIPITEGLDRLKQMEALRLQRESDQAGYRAQRNQVQLDKIQARQDAAYKEKDLLQKEKNMRLTRKNLQTAQSQFSSGRLLSGDLAQADFAYQQAKTAYLQAAYDFIVAKMYLEKISRE